MAEFGISPGQFVAVFWDKSSPEEALKKLVDNLQGLTGSEGQVFTENLSRLLQCKCCLPFLLFLILEFCRSPHFLSTLGHIVGNFCMFFSLVAVPHAKNLLFLLLTLILWRLRN